MNARLKTLSQDTHDMQVSLDGMFVQLVDAWASFNTEYQIADRSVGDMTSGFAAELHEIRLGGSVTITRAQALELFGRDAIESIEDAAARELDE